MSKNYDDERADRLFRIFLATVLIAVTVGFVVGCLVFYWVKK